MVRWKVRPFHDWLYLDRHAYRPAATVRRLPRKWQLHADWHHVRLVPLEGFSRYDQSESRERELLADLSDLPHNRRMVTRNLRSLHGKLPSDGRAHRAPEAVHGLPRQQQFQSHVDGLRFVPLDGLQ